MESLPEELIANSERVVELLGHWPSFHDATLHEFCLTKNSSGTTDFKIGIEYPVVTKEVDEEGFFVVSRVIHVAFKAFDVKCEYVRMAMFPDMVFRLYFEEIDNHSSGSQIRFCIDSTTEGGLSFLFR